MRTLAALIAEAGLETIDFLKIDVEGAEADVLAGMDFERHRPRVILLEAVAPGSMAEASAAWERDLLAQGYRFAFFDRLNRFYVAEEAKDLAARLPAEPAPWDNVQHLWDCGRAPERPDHPDHVLAQDADGRASSPTLPSLDPALLRRLIERGLDGPTPLESTRAASARPNSRVPAQAGRRSRSPARDGSAPRRAGPHRLHVRWRAPAGVRLETEPPMFFPGFQLEHIAVSAGGIRLRRGGSGPPLLLLHGNPQTHAMWHAVAPEMAKRFTVICPDLRGYGGSLKPEATPDHAPYAKREMAKDMVEVMQHLGHERFADRRA